MQQKEALKIRKDSVRKTAHLWRIIPTVLCALFFIPSTYAQADSSCIIRRSEKTVKGHSLEGVIANGSSVTLLYGFYTCNVIQRNDVVAYNYKGARIPLIKMVRGIPGDSFSLIPEENGVYTIDINGEILRESGGRYYELSLPEYRMLNMYEREYKNVIPVNTFLILGSHSGTTDSARFGLIDLKDIIGKIVW